MLEQGTRSRKLAIWGLAVSAFLGLVSFVWQVASTFFVEETKSAGREIVRSISTRDAVGVGIGAVLGAALAVYLTWFIMGTIHTRRLAAAELGRLRSALRIRPNFSISAPNDFSMPWTLHVSVHIDGSRQLRGDWSRLEKIELTVTLQPGSHEVLRWVESFVYVADDGRHDYYVSHRPVDLPPPMAFGLLKHYRENHHDPPVAHVHAWVKTMSHGVVDRFDNVVLLRFPPIPLNVLKDIDKRSAQNA